MTEDRLRKVLELERQKRFSDRAVTAGLDVFLKNITTHEGSQLSSDVFTGIQRLPVGGYKSLTPAYRKRWIEEMLDVLKAQARGISSTPPRRREAGNGKREAVDGTVGPQPEGSPRREGHAAPARKTAARPPQPRPAQVRFSPGELEGMGADAPIYALKRVPFGLGVKFDKLNVHLVRDLLLFFPRRHVDYGDPVPVSQL
ncbi:MAG: hypothetical protein HY874_07550 [Chloroflexi bacterium]|nr:hypothetical protein [Chloroflexota bacterium]